MTFKLSVFAGTTDHQKLAMDVSAHTLLMIGADPASDIILPGAPQHWLTVDAPAARILIVGALVDTEVCGRPAPADGVVTISAFSIPILKPDIEIALGELRVHLRRTESALALSPAVMAKLSQAANVRNVATACFGLLACVAIIALAWQTRSTSARTATPEIIRSAPNSSVASLAPVMGPIPARPAVGTQTALPMDLQMRHALIRMGVQSSVQVRTTAEGLVLSGKIEPQDAEAMKAAVARFQSENRVQVSDRTEIAVKTPEIRIRAASATPGFVVLEDGRRLLIGDRIRDDWQLASVSAQEVTFMRGSSTLRIPRR